MKKLLLTVIASLAFCGAILAQSTTFWPEFNPNHYQFPAAFAAFVKIDGSFVEGDFNYADLEVAAFTGNQCRGHAFMNYYPDYDPHPVLEMSLYYNTGESVPVTFWLYNHSTGIEYAVCTSNMEIITGTNHGELYFNPDDAVVLDFTTPPTFTKEITGYTTLANPEGGYYLLASPVRKKDPAFVPNMLSNEYDLYWFNQSGDPNGHQWMNYKAEAFFLERGKGYLYANSQTVTLSFTGEPLDPTIDVTIPLDYDAAAPFGLAGDNLIGNPYTQTAYLTGRSFYEMNAEGTEIVPAEDNEIEAMQGVFVVAQGTGENAVFTTTNPGKGSMISLNLSQGRGVIDRAIVRFSEGQELPKRQINPGNTKIYIPMEDKNYAVVRGEETGEMPVNFKAATDGTYTMSLSNEETPFDYLHLVDSFTGTDIDLLQNPSYSFEARSTDNVDRFKLVFVVGALSVSENFAFFNNGNLVIDNEGRATMQVVDLNGRILRSESINGCANVNIDAAPGVYMLRLVNDNNVKVQKVVVR